jgi:hypothetical protein
MEKDVINFEEKSEQKIIDPTKEVDIAETDLTVLKELEMKYDTAMMTLAFIRMDFLEKEKRLFDSLSITKVKINNEIKSLRTKYKIIGQIFKIDYDNKKITIK